MIKSQVVALVCKQTGIVKVDVEDVVNSFLNVVRQTVESGEYVALGTFGTFGLTKKLEKKARNVFTNEPIIVPTHYKPAFKPCLGFIDAVRKLKVK